jgi:hypothetical protein
MHAAPNPRTLTGRSGASSHVLRFPLRAFLRFPVCPPGSSPSSAFLWFPFVRRSPVRSLRPLPGSGSPSVSLRVPFSLGNLHVSAAAGRFRRRRSQAAGTKVTSSAVSASPGSRDPPALQMGSGRARWGCRHRIAGYERITTPLAVVAVAVVAAIISYQHAYELVRSHGESGVTARLLPFTVDGLIWAASMVVLDASRRKPARTTAGRLEPRRWDRGHGRCQPGAWRRARPHRRTGQRLARLGAGRHIRAADGAGPHRTWHPAR